jgi:hypothetical protein
VSEILLIYYNNKTSTFEVRLIGEGLIVGPPRTRSTARNNRDMLVA